jgi:hypothetical protein
MLLPKLFETNEGRETKGRSRVRRPAGVVVAAVVLGLMAGIGILGGLVSTGVAIFMQNPAVPMVPGVRIVMVLTTAMMLCFFLFCGWTVVGLFRMRLWARYSILVIGGLEFCFCALLCGMMLLLRSAPPPMAVMPAPMSFQAVLLVTAAFYGFLSLIGAWWLVYFNLAPVRAAFAGMPAPVLATAAGEPAVLAAQSQSAAPAAAVPGWRIVIIVWACLMLFSIVGLPMVLVMHMPLFLFGMVFRGTAATALLLALFAVQIFLGVGLLKKWRAAWYVALAWQVYTVAFFLAFLAPGIWAKFMAYEDEIMGRWGVTMATPNRTQMVAMNPRPFMAIGFVFGAAIVVLLTVALFQRREDYLQA